MLTARDHVVVVGGGLAGWRLCEYLRRHGFEGEITLVSDEEQLPYDRPPLSKHVLTGKWQVSQTQLPSSETLDTLHVTLRLGVAATGLDVAAHRVELADGTSVSGTHIVIATGVDARRLSVSAPEHCFVVRHADETSALLERVGAVGEGGVAVVIGGGFIGAEVATSLTARGLRVIVLEAQARPLVGPLGDTVAQWLEGLAGAAGIELRVNQRVDDVLDVDGRAHVLTGDGEIVADVIVMGVGAVATTGWLEGSGLVIDNGVVVDEELAAAPGVFVIGDLARFPLTTSLGVDHVRIEHWQVANDHAAQLAAYLTGQASPPAMIPYFWSDQYGKKIQVLGHPAPSDDVRLVSGSLEEAKWLALYSRGDVITGVVALSQPRALMVSKVLLETPHSVVDALALAPWAN